jgi:hypothetical protein
MLRAFIVRSLLHVFALLIPVINPNRLSPTLLNRLPVKEIKEKILATV